MLVCIYRTISYINYSHYSLSKYVSYYSNFYIYTNRINRIILYSISRYVYSKGDSRQMVLDLLIWIRSNIDRTLSFRSSCCEGVCGSCAMLINNLNTLACIQPIWLIDSYIVVYPLPHFNVIRDLVVDLKHFYEQYSYISPYYNFFDSSGFGDSSNNAYTFFCILNFSFMFSNIQKFNISSSFNILNIFDIYNFFIYRKILLYIFLNSLINIYFLRILFSRKLYMYSTI